MDGEGDGAILTPSFAYGFCCKVRGNVAHTEAHKVLLPVGQFVATYDADGHEMSFIQAAERVRLVSGLCVAPDRKHFACIEHLMDSDLQQVSVYNLLNEKRTRTLHLSAAPGLKSQTIVNLSFSATGKQLLMQCGAPDWCVLSWKLSAGKVSTSACCSHPVLQAQCDPWEDARFFTLSAHSLTIYRADYTAGTVKGVDMALLDAHGKVSYTACCWVVGSNLVVGNSGGDIAVYQQSEHKETLHMGEKDSIVAIVTRGRGFVAVGALGVVYLCEAPDAAAKRNGSKDLYRVSRKLPANIPGRTISGLSVSATDDHIILSTDAGELLLLDLLKITEGDAVQDAVTAVAPAAAVNEEEQEHGKWRLLCDGFYSGPLVGLDACDAQPIVAACGKDKTVRVWNYQQRSCLLHKQLLEDLLCCALHPSGFMLLIGMHDKLRLFYIVKGDLSLISELPLKKCSIARFSRGGHVFAAVGRSNTVCIYSTYGGQQLAQLKAHVSMVTDLSFSEDDRRLVSVGAGGACYFWDLADYSRMTDIEFVDKQCVYYGVHYDNTRAPGAILRTMDGKVLQLQDGRLEHSVSSIGSQYAPMLALANERVLLAANDTGSVLVLPWPHKFPAPQLDPSSVKEYRLHSSRITHMSVCPASGLLLTASADGVLIASSLALVLDGVLVSSHGVGNASVAGSGGSKHAAAHQCVLMYDADVDALRARIKELHVQLSAVQLDAQYQIFRFKQQTQDKLSHLEQDLSDTQSKLAKRTEELHAFMNSAQAHEQQVVDALEKLHGTAAEELEALYEKRLEIEAERHKQLTAARDDLQYTWEERLKRVERQHADEIAALRSQHRAAIEQEQAATAAALQAQADMEVEYDELLTQTEADLETHVDRYTDRLHDANKAAEEMENRLKAENNLLKRTNLRLKGEKATDLKKLDGAAADCKALQQQVELMSRTADRLRVEVVERDEVIASMNANVAALRSRVQELEKHKSVLSYKAEGFQAELEPLEAEVATLNRHLEAQSRELLSEAGSLKDLERAVREKESYIRSLKSEIQELKDGRARQEVVLNTFSHDLVQVMGQPDERTATGKSERQRALERLYKKYCQGDRHKFKTAQDVENELLKQVQVAELKNYVITKRMESVQDQSQQSTQRRLNENAQLLGELAELQQQNRQLARQLQAAQAAYDELVEATARRANGHGGSEARTEAARGSSNATSARGNDAHGVGGGWLARAAELGAPKAGGSDMRHSREEPASTSRPMSAAASGRRPSSAVLHQGAGLFRVSLEGPLAITSTSGRSVSTPRSGGSTRRPASAQGHLLSGSSGRALQEALQVEQQQRQQLQHEVDVRDCRLEAKERQLSELQQAVRYARELQGTELGEELRLALGGLPQSPSGPEQPARKSGSAGVTARSAKSRPSTANAASHRTSSASGDSGWRRPSSASPRPAARTGSLPGPATVGGSGMQSLIRGETQSWRARG